MMFEHFETVIPYGRKDAGMPALHGLRHEIYDALMSIDGYTHSKAMEWLCQHTSDERSMLMNIVSYLIAHGICYGYHINRPHSLGAKLLKYYTLEELASKWKLYRVDSVILEIDEYPDTDEPGIGILYRAVPIQLPIVINGADEDLPF